MKLEQFIITRFCCRKHDHTGYCQTLNDSALDPENIKTRLMLLEMVSMPSLLAQTSRDFKWVIIIDEALGNEYFNALEKVTRNEIAVYFHRTGTEQELAGLDWLNEYIDGQPDYILTTNQDDDDALPANFCEKLRSHIFPEFNAGSLPPVKLFGFKKTIQWNMEFTPRYPFGTLSPWHRTAAVTSCGYSLLCKYPQYNFNVLNFRHALGEYYLEDTEKDVLKFRKIQSDHVFQQRNLVKEAALHNNHDYKTDFQEQQTFYDISIDTGPNLLTNHYYNVQATRLGEVKESYTPVKGSDSFPNMVINWDKVRNYAGTFESQRLARLTFLQYILYLIEKTLYRASSRNMPT